jgi:hypothetical protein
MKNAFERYGWKAPQWISIWAIWAEMSPIERSYQQINRSLRKLGQPQPMEATPADRARRLIKILPRAEKAILVLAQEHQNALYTQSQASLSRARQASWKIVLETLRARIRITILGYN